MVALEGALCVDVEVLLGGVHVCAPAKAPVLWGGCAGALGMAPLQLQLPLDT